MTERERFEELASELEGIAERLTDLAMDLLRQGLDNGTDEAAASASKTERLVTRARSSVAKAMSLLERAADDVGAQ